MEKKNNSVIFKNPYDRTLHDITFAGTYDKVDTTIQIEQNTHGFQIGEVLCYDIKSKQFSKALAINSIESEVCGVVSNILGVNTFQLLTEGYLKTDKYSFDIGTPLYLSESTSGKLTSIEPKGIVKQVATQTNNGIMIDIQRGYKISDTTVEDEVLESYTQEELDEIIKNIW